jgi:hypothetical protein
MELERLTYPAYEQPLLSAYEGRFECAYAVLHPFLRIAENAVANVSRYPTDEQVAASGEKYHWRQVATEANLKTYSEINHGLLSLIRALKQEFQNEDAAQAIENVLNKTGCVWMPPEGVFPVLLHLDIISAFETGQADEMVFIPEFPDLDPVQHLEVADLHQAARVAFPGRGTLVPPDAKFLFTVDWDSFFTLFYGPSTLVAEVVKERQIEGFFLGRSTRHGWWSESVPIPVT